MLLEQTVQVKWSGNNKIHYENKGYKYTKCGEYFNCKAEDLSIGSDYRVKVQCDYCGEIYDKQFKKYILHRNILAKDACQKCQNKKCRDIKLIKYGCCSPKIFCNWEALNNQRFIIVQDNIWKQIQTICKERDYILISKSYKNNHSKIQYICNKHFNEGIKEINWIHLRDGEGCKSCGIEKSALSQRFTQAEVKKIIEEDYKEYGCKLIGEYINYNDYNLELKCNCGEIFTTSLSWFIRGKRKCNICSIALFSGENHPKWKGGITSLCNYLRGCISEWRKDSFKQSNYKCVITGSTKNKVIHHLYGFNQIIQETMETLNLPIYQEINQYTRDELKSIEDLCLKLHYKYGLGVCICEEEHKLFHSIYGYGNNTPEQFEEFKRIRLLQIQQDSLLLCSNL